jgi:hypothetical protein
VSIAANRELPGRQAVYNLEVEGEHEYFVGQSEVLSHNQSCPPYTPDRALPVNKNMEPVPDVDVPHTQLGRSRPKFGAEPQAREWDVGSNGKLQPKRDIDFTDHGSPSVHPKPHQHELVPNNSTLAPKGGYQRGPPKPL